MKISAVLLFIFILQLHAGSSWSQTTSINLSMRSVTVETVLDQIENDTDYTFLFMDENVDTKRVVNIDVETSDIDVVLKQLFRNTRVSYKVVNNQVILSDESHLAKQTQQRQGKKITGKVIDELGDPVLGANVIEKNSGGNGTVTDLDGNFELTVSDNAILTVTYIGYNAQEVKIDNRNMYSIVMKEDSKALDEVVVVGYGTMKKKDLTGSIASVKGDIVAERRTTELSSALQGAIAGVSVSRDSGNPGASSTIRIRGTTTIGDSNPLYIIDGVPGNIDHVNPNDVESISVLKDAASAAIYGSRAAAGVILITTKRATEGSLSLTYNYEYGVQIPTNEPKNVGVQRFLEMTNELRYNDNTAGGYYQTYSEDQVANWIKYNQTDPNNYPITDWVDLILSSSAPRQTHSLVMTGGNNSVKSKASFTYDDIDGLYGERNYKRYMVRINNDFNFNKYWGASLDLSVRRAENYETHYSPFEAMRISPPVYAAVWDDGRIAEGKSGGNPYGLMLLGGDKNNNSTRLNGKISLDLKPIDGLKFTGTFAPNFYYTKGKEFKKTATYTLASDPDIIGGYLEDNANPYSTTKLTESRNDDFDFTFQFIGNYTKTIGRHDFSIMGGYENYYAKSEKLTAGRDQYELTQYPYLNVGPDTYRTNSGYATEYAYRSIFGRISYSFDNKYLFQANIRRDGSSRFMKDHRWGVFPSFSAGWVISEEAFFEGVNKDVLSFLKFRGSWGALGNERISDTYYPAVSSMEFGRALMYQNGSIISVKSAVQSKYAVEEISWEKTQSYDIGFDANFFNNRLRVVFDYYKKTTKDMLLALNIPTYLGFKNPNVNAGKMHTKGWDLELGWNDRIGQLTYGVSFNISDYVSRMGDLKGTQFMGDRIKMEGSEFNEWYGYVSDGLFLTQEELDNSPTISGTTQLGDIKYLDISGPDGEPDGVISPEYDRILLGSSSPHYSYGGNISLGYKGIDFSMAFHGIGKVNKRMGEEMVQPLRKNWGNIPAILEGNYWSSFNTDEQNARARYPRLTWANQGSNNAMSDYWMFNGRYFRMKNITIGYTIPKELSQKVFIERLRFYFTGTDLFTFNKYPKGWDPEMDAKAYPITMSLLFGINVNF